VITAPERTSQTDGQTDEQTDIIVIIINNSLLDVADKPQPHTIQSDRRMDGMLWHNRAVYEDRIASRGKNWIDAP